MKFHFLIALILVAAFSLLAVAFPESQEVNLTSPAAYASGTTASLGGGALLVGTPATITATLSGPSVAAGKPCYAAPSDGTSLTSVGTGLGLTVYAMTTATNTATVYVGVTVAGTPTAKTYNVVCFP